MTTDIERSRALESFGYTRRQAHFLVLAALHGGYFLRRHYVTFTGRAHGQAAVRFIASVSARGHVRVLPFGGHGHVFHLCGRPFYAAIGQEHNRNRRPAESTAVVRKLMTLDFVLAHPGAQFWATEEDKVALLQQLNVPPALWPVKRYAPRRPGGLITTRHFVDKMPWVRHGDDPRLWFAYVDVESTLSGFETFLGQYRDLLMAVASGVTYVSSGAWPGPVDQVFQKVMGKSTRPSTLSVSSFLDYCRLRREVEADRFDRISVADIVRFRELRSKFATDFLDSLYTCWLRDGDPAVSDASLKAQPQELCVLRVHALNSCHSDQRPATAISKAHRG